MEEEDSKEEKDPVLLSKKTAAILKQQAEQQASEAGGMEEDEDPVSLSSATLAILRDFLADKEQAEQNASKDPFAEDWGMSQFWYTEETAAKVADEVTRSADGGSIACVACPSLFRRIRAQHPQQEAHLFEFDERFAVLGNFSFYDYNEPHGIPAGLQRSFKVIIIDPPYLSRECLEKCIQTMLVLADAEQCPAYFALTGAAMQDVAMEMLRLRPVKWRPEHKNKLGNEFCFYVQSDETAERFGGWDE